VRGGHITQTRTHLYGKKNPIGKNFESPPPKGTQGSENFAQNVGPWGGGLSCKYFCTSWGTSFIREGNSPKGFSLYVET